MWLCLKCYCYQQHFHIYVTICCNILCKWFLGLFYTSIIILCARCHFVPNVTHMSKIFLSMWWYMLQHFVQMVLRSIWHEGTHITRIVYFVLNLTLTLNLNISTKISFWVMYKSFWIFFSKLTIPANLDFFFKSLTLTIIIPKIQILFYVFLADPYSWVPKMGWGSTNVVKFTSDLDFYLFQSILRHNVFEGEKNIF